MKKINILILFLSLFSFGYAGEFTLALESFESVEVLGNFTVNMVKSESNKLVVTNKDVKVEDNEILAVEHDGHLKIQIQRDNYTKRNIVMTLYYTDIKSISAKRGAVVEAEHIVTEKLSLSVNAGGKIKLKANVKDADLSIKSGGVIKISGHADEAVFNLQAGGNIVAFLFEVKRAKAEVQMGGEIILNVTDELTASVKAGGEIKYKGVPKKVNKTIKLGGNIESM